MDARILWSGDSLQAARYALQYAIKRQSVLDNVAVVEMAFKRRVSRECALQSSVYSQGVGRLLALAYSTSGVMEIGGPLATAILLEGEAVTFGCVFERLVLLEGLNLLNNSAVEASVVTRNHALFAETSISRYLARPRCLQGMCWYDFCAWISPIGTPEVSIGEHCTFVSDDPQELREHLRHHGYRHLNHPRVPEIIGPRLPDASRLGNEDYNEQTELYHRMAALLYHPFREVRAFLDASGSARAHFERWLPCNDITVARRLDYHQQYYIGLQKAQEYRAKQNSPSENDSDDETYDDDDIDTRAHHQQFAAQTALHYETVPADLYATDVDMNVESRDEPLVPTEDTSPAAQLLFQSIACTPMPPDESFSVTASTNVITRACVRQFENANRGGGAVPTRAVGALDTTETTTAVTVEALRRAIQDLSYDNERHPVCDLEPCSSITDVSAQFRLNRLQHIAFTLIAVPLLGKLLRSAIPSADLRSAIPSAENALFDETPVIVTGAGGTGKSQIIMAIRALVASWGHPRAVAVVASTGMVAASLQGSTMHSSVGLGINATKVPQHIRTPSDSLLQQWAPVECVIADEVSMTDNGFFGLWEESLQYAKEDRSRDYGGLLTVLMFDHCQLRCIKGLPMYRESKPSGPLTEAQRRGVRLYRRITKVVYLTENMRFIEDPEWGSWLASGRLGNWTSDCRDFIASLRHRDRRDEPSSPGAFKTISTDNQTRAATNDLAVRTAIRIFGSGRKVYVVPAQLSRRVVPSEVALLRQLPDNDTGHIPLFLYLYIGEITFEIERSDQDDELTRRSMVGMPVRVKENQCVSKGVANGASATVHHIDWDTTTTFSLQSDGAWLASERPRNVYVDVAKCPSPIRFPEIPNHWPASVMPVHLSSASIKKMAPALSIKGYPIVPAFGTTVHGVQGETLDTVAVTNLRPPHVRCVDSHALYVALSRLRTRRGLNWVGSSPTMADFDFFRPDPDVLLEDNRLNRLARATLATFNRIASTVSS